MLGVGITGLRSKGLGSRSKFKGIKFCFSVRGLGFRVCGAWIDWLQQQPVDNNLQKVIVV